jgi:hypothetical protein
VILSGPFASTAIEIATVRISPAINEIMIAILFIEYSLFVLPGPHKHAALATKRQRHRFRSKVHDLRYRVLKAWWNYHESDSRYLAGTGLGDD